MATKQRQPLGASTLNNVHPEKAVHNSVKHHSIDEEKMVRKLQAESTEQGRKRAEAEGSSEVWKRDLENSRKEVELLKKDLERAKGKLSRRDETIKQLEIKARDKSATPNTELEKKLSDLVERHQNSKLKYHNQITALEATNASLQETLSSQINELIALKGKQESTEKENKELRMEIKSIKQREFDTTHINRKENRDHGHEKAEWRIEKHRLERQITNMEHELGDMKSTLSREKSKEDKILKKEDDLRSKNYKLEKECMSFHEKVKEMEEIEEDNEKVKCQLEASSIIHRLLYRDSVPQNQYRTMEQNYIEAKSQSLRWQNKAEILEIRINQRTEQNANLKAQLQNAQEERQILEEVLEVASKEKQDLREELAILYSNYIPHNNIKPLKPLPELPALDLALTHNSISSSWITEQRNNFETRYFDLLSDYEQARSSLLSSSSTLTALQVSFAQLQNSYHTLEQSHSPCSAQIANLQFELTKVQNNLTSSNDELLFVNETMKKSDKQAKEDREALKRANEVVMRSKLAEEALDEEIKHLQEAYTEAAKYQEMYLGLKEQYEILESRELAAVEEAERLGMENAELVGHNNEGQKINYVEGVRREMVMVKQELASTRHLLNISNDKIINLENEIQAYKSINPIQSQTDLGSSRTKVLRRQPENGRLTVSRNGLTKSRSVSQPVWR
ncbi:uncharacterized protein L201_006899 [Kwoniella dendrophila CBS 6074]|uniref:Hyaluronan-mediated motility receptor C-terminal domain-containing protein n=1 Tax=Kwoniella dendrophila CBS 6074 TaxID=1295534 RepID=A0AAX4K514_9TREE